MTTENQNVVMVSTLGLSNDIVVDTLLDNGVDDEISSDLTGLKLLENRGSILLADAQNRGVFPERSTEGTGDGARLVVVDDGTSSASRLGVEGLSAKVAGTTADEGNVALDLGRIVLNITTQVVNLDQRSRNLTSRRVCHGIRRHILSVHREGTIGLSEDLGEGLLDDIEVVKAVERVVQPIDGGVVAARAESAVAAVLVGKVLQLLGSGEEGVESDELLELLRVDETAGAVVLEDLGAGERGERERRGDGGGGCGLHLEGSAVGMDTEEDEGEGRNEWKRREEGTKGREDWNAGPFVNLSTGIMPSTILHHLTRERNVELPTIPRYLQGSCRYQPNSRDTDQKRRPIVASNPGISGGDLSRPNVPKSRCARGTASCGNGAGDFCAGGSLSVIRCLLVTELRRGANPVWRAHQGLTFCVRGVRGEAEDGLLHVSIAANKKVHPMMLLNPRQLGLGARLHGM